MMSVMMSAVGVMTAARTRMATMAWRRYCAIQVWRSMPNLASSQAMTGISKTMPKTRDINSRVST